MKFTAEQIQEITLDVQWDAEQYMQGLSSYLKQQKVTTLLDTCGGTGFPTLGLRQSGWQVTYADGSEPMSTLFLEKARSLGLAIPAYTCHWFDLSTTIPDRFDFVMCRGNSLVYIDSWNDGKISEKTPFHILQALQQFYAMLNPGGLLYVDIYKENDPEHLNWQKDFTWVSPEGEKLDFVSILNVFPEQKKRYWRFRLKSNEKENLLERESYYLTHAELEQLLLEAGFQAIQEVNIPGENVFTTYTARRPG